MKRQRREGRCGILPQAVSGASCSGLFLLLLACDSNHELPTQEAVATETTLSSTPWPITRGGPSLSGRVSGPAPHSPEVAWTFTLDSPGTAEAAATTDVIVVGDVMGFLYAIDFETHELLWKFETEDTIEAAPAIHEDRVFVGSGDGSFHALDLKTGDKIWSIGGNEKFSSAPNLIPGPDGSLRLVVNGYDGTTRCLDPADGTVLWTYETQDYINGTPALVDGKLAFGGCDTVLHVLDAGTGEKLNAIPTESQITDSIATAGNTLYAANYANQVVAAESDATEPTWIYQSDDFPFFSAPAVDDDHVYIGCRDKALHAIKRADGTGAWTFPTGGRIESSPIVFDDAVVFGSSDGRLYALDPTSGKELWRLDLGEKLTAAPIFAGGHLIIAGGEGTVFVVR
ncbi:PQQ-binding-like beta-propeller repeat protein [Haloferula sp. A504]|uniref:outer membrane protein assembly factor BamB family protein n=1 Tax=Haloferula sp. A504 TaxID=3373601 RepID=UPI0037A03D77